MISDDADLLARRNVVHEFLELALCVGTTLVSLVAPVTAGALHGVCCYGSSGTT